MIDDDELADTRLDGNSEGQVGYEGAESRSRDGALTLGRAEFIPTQDPVTLKWACRRCRNFCNSDSFDWCRECEKAVVAAAKKRHERQGDAIKPVRLNAEQTRSLLVGWKAVERLLGAANRAVLFDSTTKGAEMPVDYILELLSVVGKVNDVLGPVVREVSDSLDAEHLYYSARLPRKR